MQQMEKKTLISVFRSVFSIITKIKKSHLDFDASGPSSVFPLMAHSCITFPLVNLRSQNDATVAKESEFVYYCLLELLVNHQLKYVCTMHRV